MPAYYVQSGTSLQKITSSGTISTLTLPTGITIDSTKRGRFALLGRKVVLVNSPTRNLVIDPFTDTVSPLVLAPPRSAPVAAASSGAGALTGDYSVKHTFGIRDDDGAIISQSPYGPVSNTVTLTSKLLNVAGIERCPDSACNFRRVYRTLAGGSVYFNWIDVDGNTETTVEAGIADAALELLPGPTDFGAPPGTFQGSGLYLIAQWKGYLWARETNGSFIDKLRFSASGQYSRWPAANAFSIPQVGSDEFGITAFAPRRDEFGVFKRDSLHKIVGNSESDFRRTTVVEGVGCIAPESVVIIYDVAYFLTEKGVYRWTNEGVKPVSDRVIPWFTTDTYFNRSQFPNARGTFDPDLGCYRLQLAGTGSTDLDRWVDYYIRDNKWYGPHKTEVGTPTAVALLEDSNDLDLPVICTSDGYVYKMNQSTFSDVGAATNAIDFDVTTGWHSGNTPRISKFWGFLTLLTKVQAAGTLTVTPTVGKTNASAGSAISHALTSGGTKERRLGLGPLLRLRFRHNTAGQGATIFGYEIPFFEVGERL